MTTASKPQNSLRLYFQNINGIKKNSWTEWEEAAKAISSTGIDIFGCAETNLACVKI
jgi:hypothetical protein